MLNHNYLLSIFVFCECFFARNKKCVSAPTAGARSLILRVLLRTKQKVRVSPKGWCTVFDFASAKLINIGQFTK